MKEKIILVGGGGHCRSCIEVIESQNVYDIVGIIDLKEKYKTKIFSYEIIGNDDDLQSLTKSYKNFFITIGHLKNPKRKIELYNLLKNNNVNLPVIIASSAIVSKYANVAEGTIIMHGAIINAGAIIGSNTIINTGAIIEHDTIIGNNCHISTCAVVNGGAIIRDNSFIGSHSVVKEMVTVCDNVIIGSGAIVVKNVTEEGTYIGMPATKIKEK